MSKISIINDEISDQFNVVINFLNQHELKYVELRSFNKINIADCDLSQLKKYKQVLKRNKIKVSAIAAPLLKWLPKKHQEIGVKGKFDNFYFTKGDSIDFEKVFQIADLFETKYIRIFSYLKYKGFRLNDLSADLEVLINLARKYNKILVIENEPVCNIDTLEKLERCKKKYKSERLKILFDPGNLYKQGLRVDYQVLDRLLNDIAMVHVKDYSFEEQQYKVLGEGDINYKKLFGVLKNNKDLFYSLETHTQGERIVNSAQAVKKIKEIINTQRVKYGIIGCGRVLKKHIAAIKADKNSELIGVFDIDKKRMYQTAVQYDCENFASVNDLINSVDIVNICTPHNTHADLICKVLKSGKKCLAEKPGSLIRNDYKKIVRNIKHQDDLFVVFQNRFNDPVLELEEILGKLNFGKLIYVYGNIRWFRPKSYYKNSWQGKKHLEGGILFNQGIHLLDLLIRRFKSKGNVKVLNALKGKFLHKKIQTEDFFISQFVQGGCTYNFEVNVSLSPSNLETKLLLVFTNGRIEIGGLAFNKYIAYSLEGENYKEIYSQAPNYDVYGFGHKELIKKLSQYYLTGKKDPNLVNYQEAFKRIELIINLYEQAKETNT